MFSQTTQIALMGLGSSRLRLDEVWEPGQVMRPDGLTAGRNIRGTERNRPVIVPLSEDCMQVEYTGALDDKECRALFDAVKKAAFFSPNNMQLLMVIEDVEHRTKWDVLDLVKQLMPADLQGRVAVVWANRWFYSDGLSIRPNASGAETRLYGAAHYRHALDWLGVMYR